MLPCEYACQSIYGSRSNVSVLVRQDAAANPAPAAAGATLRLSLPGYSATAASGGVQASGLSAPNRHGGGAAARAMDDLFPTGFARPRTGSATALLARLRPNRTGVSGRRGPFEGFGAEVHLASQGSGYPARRDEGDQNAVSFRPAYQMK